VHFFSFLGKSPGRSWNVLGFLQILINKLHFFVNLTISPLHTTKKSKKKRHRKENKKALVLAGGSSTAGRHSREDGTAQRMA
jgi:hypothetical protein